MKRLEVQTGDRFGMLTVVNETEKVGTYRMFNLQCDCGGTTTVRLSHLRRTVWPVRSCGCQQRKQQEAIGDQRRTHGQSQSQIYDCWCSMKSRCENPNNKRSYPNYGGRGIRVCERWQTFENFLADMGERPSDKHQLDRIDNDGNYEPGNVRWATRAQQVRNRRKLPGSSQYRGVDFWLDLIWRARITIDGKLVNLGTFDSELDAARAYDEAARPLGFHTNFKEQ